MDGVRKAKVSPYSVIRDTKFKAKLRDYDKTVVLDLNKSFQVRNHRGLSVFHNRRGEGLFYCASAEDIDHQLISL